MGANWEKCGKIEEKRSFFRADMTGLASKISWCTHMLILGVRGILFIQLFLKESLN